MRKLTKVFSFYTSTVEQRVSPSASVCFDTAFQCLIHRKENRGRKPDKRGHPLSLYSCGRSAPYTKIYDKPVELSEWFILFLYI